jgi:predicted permease
MSRFELPLWRRLFRLPTPDPREAAADVDAELEFHLQMRVDELVALGMTEAEARAEALRRFGNLGRARGDLTRDGESRARRHRMAAWLEDLGQDLRLAMRGIRRRPVLAAVATVTLALGLGLTTTVLAVVNRLVLHALPYPGAERFASVLLASDETAMRISPTLRMLGAWRAHAPGSEWIEAHSREELLLENGEAAELVQTRSVTPGLLPALGARVVAGRGIEPVDTAAGAPFVALLSWGAWQRRYGGSPDVIGRTVRLDGKIAAVVGVLERGFDLSPLDVSARAEFWLPLGGPGKSEESAWVLLRRRPGVPVEAITGELRAALQVEGIISDLLERFPPRASDPGEFADEDRERTLWLLTLAVSLVLAIACANVAALLLGQAAVRAREFGVRAALGAGRGRVVRQLVTEAGLLGALGGIAGFAVAKAALWLMRATRPENLLTLDDVALDPGVTLAELGLTLSVAILFGLAPAWAVSRADAAAALVGRVKRSLDSRFGRSLRSALVVGQLAASLVLVSGAGLLVKSFFAEREVPIGFDPAGLGWVDFSLSPRLIPTEAERAAIAEEARAAVSRMPELEAVALAGDSPVGHGIIMGEFLIDGRPLPDRETETMIPYRSIGPGYFDAIGARLEAGRQPDSASGELEIVVDATTAERFFPDGDVLGSRVRYSRTGGWKTIVGVAPNQRALIGAFPEGPFVFESRQRSARDGALIVRAHGDVPLQRISALVRAVDPRIRIRSAETAESALDERLAGRRFTMTIMIGFAGLALLLAAVGLYGVVALAVSQRTYEMGVRIALGAAPSNVRLLVLREGGMRVALGLGLGFVLLVALGRLLRGLLSDVRAWDPVVWGAAAVALAMAGVLACWIPARRASRTDPMIALRAE